MTDVRVCAPPVCSQLHRSLWLMWCCWQVLVSDWCESVCSSCLQSVTPVSVTNVMLTSVGQWLLWVCASSVCSQLHGSLWLMWRCWQVFRFERVKPTLSGLSLPDGLTVCAALERVLRLPAVASKRYLTNKVGIKSVTPFLIKIPDSFQIPHMWYYLTGPSPMSL